MLQSHAHATHQLLDHRVVLFIIIHGLCTQHTLVFQFKLVHHLVAKLAEHVFFDHFLLHERLEVSVDVELLALLVDVLVELEVQTVSKLFLLYHFLFY